jgi:hypothetical protein
VRAVAKARRKTIVYAFFVIARTKTADKRKDGLDVQFVSSGPTNNVREQRTMMMSLSVNCANSFLFAYIIFLNFYMVYLLAPTHGAWGTKSSACDFLLFFLANVIFFFCFVLRYSLSSERLVDIKITKFSTQRK